MLKLLSTIAGNIQFNDEQSTNTCWSENCRLISTDLVTCARHLDFLVRHFVTDFLKSQPSPFGKLTDYWYIMKFQNALLWIENALKYTGDNASEVVNYVDRHLSCKRSWNDQDLNYQLHKHTRACRKLIRKSTVALDFLNIP